MLENKKVYNTIIIINQKYISEFKNFIYIIIYYHTLHKQIMVRYDIMEQQIINTQDRSYVPMENKRPTYIRTDNNKIINEQHIRWVQKTGDCLEVCIKMTGYNMQNNDTHKICKLNNIDSYNKLNKFF